MSASRLQQLSAAGVSVWIDSLSREMLESGELARLVAEDSVTGVTSNPSIFQKALATGDLYDAQLREVAAATHDPVEIFFGLAMDDIRAACDVLRPVYDRTAGLDGWVSLEVDPTLAYDGERTFAQARRFAKEVDRANLYVKIPATQPGLAAIEDCIARGTSINVTLIFSLERYAAVVDAYIRGVERLVVGGWARRRSRRSRASSSPASTARSTAGWRRPAATTSPAVSPSPTRGSPTSTGSRRSAPPAGRSGRPRGDAAAVPLGLDLDQEPGVPRRRVRRGAIGASTVNTMPMETLVAFRDHGEVRRDSILEGVAEARQLLADLAAAGIDYDDVVATLEAEGVDKFADAFTAAGRHRGEDVRPPGGLSLR